MRVADPTCIEKSKVEEEDDINNIKINLYC